MENLISEFMMGDVLTPKSIVVLFILLSAIQLIGTVCTYVWRGCK